MRHRRSPAPPAAPPGPRYIVRDRANDVQVYDPSARRLMVALGDRTQFLTRAAAESAIMQTTDQWVAEDRARFNGWFRVEESPAPAPETRP